MNVRDFNVKTSSPDEDRLETVLHFVGETFPRVFVINRLDREVDFVTVDGERFERVRERETANDGEYVYKRERIANGVYTAESTGEEIVRCRDCRFYEEAGFCNWFECSYCNGCQRVELDGFCAWGVKRKEGDA